MNKLDLIFEGNFKGGDRASQKGVAKITPAEFRTRHVQTDSRQNDSFIAKKS